MQSVRSRGAGEATAFGTLALLAVLGALQSTRSGGDPARAWLASAAELGGLLALVLRRSSPLPVLAVTGLCSACAAVVADRTTIGPLLPAIAMYSLAVVATWRGTAAAWLAASALYATVAVADGNPAVFLAALAMFSVAAALGMYIGEHRRLVEQGEAEQRLVAAQAVLAERVWIARELHDAIGHHVSLLVVQAGAVRSTLPETHPGWPLLTAMIDGGREAMAEMRRLVDVLRPVDDGEQPTAGDADDFRPVPGIEDLPRLAERLRASGLPVDIHLDVDTPPERTASTTAYRIVQEALTNVLKHAGKVDTRVEITRRGTALDLRVTNAPPTATPPAVGSGGQGLDGIRRRAALFNGDLTAGPVPGGGYALRATLTLRESP